MTGKKFSDEHRKNLSERAKVSMNDESVKRAISKKLIGVKTYRVPNTAFKKGSIPWNKGKKFTGNHAWKNNGKREDTSNV